MLDTAYPCYDITDLVITETLLYRTKTLSSQSHLADEDTLRPISPCGRRRSPANLTLRTKTLSSQSHLADEDTLQPTHLAITDKLNFGHLFITETLLHRSVITRLYVG